MIRNIKIGDIVQKVNNPKPVMTVELIKEDTVHVIWFDKNLNLHKDKFKRDSLKIFNGKI